MIECTRAVCSILLTIEKKKVNSIYQKLLEIEKDIVRATVRLLEVINTTRENLQIAERKPIRRLFRSLN